MKGNHASDFPGILNVPLKIKYSYLPLKLKFCTTQRHKRQLQIFYVTCNVVCCKRAVEASQVESWPDWAQMRVSPSFFKEQVHPTFTIFFKKRAPI